MRDFMPIRRTQSVPTAVDTAELASVIAEAGDTFGNIATIERARSVPAFVDTAKISTKEFDSAIAKARDEFGNARLDFLFCDLSEIKFNLTSTFKRSSFIGTKFGYEADLSNLDLEKANFSHAHLSRANLSKANLSKAHLWKADFSYTNLWKADLSGA